MRLDTKTLMDLLYESHSLPDKMAAAADSVYATESTY